MVQTNHVISENLKSRKVTQSIQGTNQKDMSMFNDISQKALEMLNDGTTELTPSNIRLIRSLDCPHLNQLLDHKLQGS